MIQFVSVVTFLHSSIFIQIKLLLNKSKWNKNFDIVSTDDCTVPLKIKMALKYGNSSRLRPSSLQISQNFKGGDFRDQPRPVLWRNPFVRDSHYIESKQFLFCTSKQWLLTVFLLKKKKKKKKKWRWYEVIKRLSPDEKFSERTDWHQSMNTNCTYCNVSGRS